MQVVDLSPVVVQFIIPLPVKYSSSLIQNQVSVNLLSPSLHFHNQAAS